MCEVTLEIQDGSLEMVVMVGYVCNNNKSGEFVLPSPCLAKIQIHLHDYQNICH